MELDEVPGRQRHFYRKEKIMHKMVEQIKKDSKLKLEEKKKILEALKKKLAEAKEEEISVIADNLFQASGSPNLGKITAIEIEKNRIKYSSSSDLNYEEIADNVYSSLMEENEIKKLKERNTEEKPSEMEEKIEELDTGEEKAPRRHGRRQQERKKPEPSKQEAAAQKEPFHEEKPNDADDDRLSVKDLADEEESSEDAPDYGNEEDSDKESGDDFSLEGMKTEFGLDA